MGKNHPLSTLDAEKYKANMTRRGRRGIGQGAATDTKGGNAKATGCTDAGTDSGQPKSTPAKPATHDSPSGAPLKLAGAPRTMPRAQVTNNNSQNTPPRGPRKPRGPREDPRNRLYANNERLWDPSKGIKMTPKQSPPESQREFRPNTLATPVKGATKTGDLNMANNGEIPAPIGRVNRSRKVSPPQHLETRYIVEETYDPDSFDRGQTVQRKTSPQPNRAERRRRGRERQAERQLESHRQQEDLQREQNRILAKNHWGAINIEDDAVQEQFQAVVRNMQEEQEIRNMQKKGDEESNNSEDGFFEQPIPPSFALLRFLANKDDKILGRFVDYPVTASGHRHHDHGVRASSSLVVQTANLTLMNGTHADGSTTEEHSRTDIEEEKSLDAFFGSLHKDRAVTGTKPNDNIHLAEIGGQFT
ncbi:hypothetical protein V8F20_003534 [Naviculisporaceae sp. PSN 640]